jgi:predicted RNA polymerase sigma factor
MPTLDLTGRHPAVVSIMRWFEHGHLPARLAAVAAPCADLATQMVEVLPDGPELTAGLRKLLEAKDCLVRAELDRTGERVIPRDEDPKA